MKVHVERILRELGERLQLPGLLPPPRFTWWERILLRTPWWRWPVARYAARSAAWVKSLASARRT